MKLSLLLSILLTYLLVACQARLPARKIASDINLSSALDIPKLGPTNVESPSMQSIAGDAEQKMRYLEDISGRMNFSVEVVESTLEDGVAVRFSPEIREDGKFVLKLLTNEPDEGSRLLTKKFIDRLADKNVIMTYYDFFEWSYNIKHQHAESALTLQRLKMQALEDIDASLVTPSSPGSDSLQEQLATFQDMTKEHNRSKSAAETARKSVLTELDRAGESEQLKELIAANKRTEVADLLEKYLPREQMAPMELHYWNEMLEAIRNPAELKDRVLVYRGLDGDRMYKGVDDQGFFMSSLLTKNQGSWNRRLRSLQAMNDKYIGVNNGTNSNQYSRNFRISTFFKQHSREPRGSPFLSYSTDINIARDFGNQMSAAFLVDKRTLLFNSTSALTFEVEFLGPLFTFPDEVVDVYEASAHGPISIEGLEQRVDDKLKAKLVNVYGEVEGSSHYDKIVQNQRSSRFATAQASNGFLTALNKKAVATSDSSCHGILQSLISH